MSDRRLRSPTLYPIELRALTLADASADLKSASNAHETPTTQNQSFDTSTRVGAEEKLTALSALEPLPVDEREPADKLSAIAHLPKVPIPEVATGIYFLLREGRVVYVGRALNIYARIAQHAEDKQFDRAVYVPAPVAWLEIAEAALIRAFRPELNRVAPFGRPEMDDQAFAAIGLDLKRSAHWTAPRPAGHKRRRRRLSMHPVVAQPKGRPKSTGSDR